MNEDNLREWLRQQSASQLADVLTVVASELGERGWTVEAGEVLGVVAALTRRREG